MLWEKMKNKTYIHMFLKIFGRNKNKNILKNPFWASLIVFFLSDFGNAVEKFFLDSDMTRAI